MGEFWIDRIVKLAVIAAGETRCFDTTTAVVWVVSELAVISTTSLESFVETTGSRVGSLGVIGELWTDGSVGVASSGMASAGSTVVSTVISIVSWYGASAGVSSSAKAVLGAIINIASTALII